jgi:hypothetical protein
VKVGQLRDVFESVGSLYRVAGNSEAADAFKEISGLCAGYDNVTVAAFATLLQKVAGNAAADAAQT